MPKRPIIIISAVILGLLAVVLTGIYLRQQRETIQIETKEEIARMQETQASILVAVKDIPKGATLDSDMLESKVVPREYIQPQAVSNADRVIGMVSLAPISKGEQITLSKLVSSKQATASSLAMATPVGKRAVSVSVDNISSLMGMIRPGDYVDVIGLIPVPVQMPDGKQATQVTVMPLFQNILILAVGRDLGALASDARYRKEGDTATSTQGSLITLALTPQEANLIAFVQEQSKIRLVLRSPADSRIEPIQPASWDTLFQYLMPKLPQGQKEQEISLEEAQAMSQEKTREIEIYRGLKKEVIAVTK